MVEIERKRKMAELNKKKIDIKLKASPVWAIPTVMEFCKTIFISGTLASENIHASELIGPDKGPTLKEKC